MASAPQLARYRSPGAFPSYQEYDPNQLARQAANQDQSVDQNSQSDFNNRYPQLAGATNRYASNTSDLQYDSTGRIADENTNAYYLNQQAANRGNTQSRDQATESTALSQLGNTSTLTGLTNSRSNLNAQGRSTESQGLTNTGRLASSYSQDPTWNRLESQGMAQTNDSTYQGLRSQATNLISGNQPISPLVQQEMMRAGLTGAGRAFGTANLGTGTAGQAGAARNLGESVNDYVGEQMKRGQSLLGSANSYQQAGLNQLGTAQSGQSSNASNFGTVQGALRSNAGQQVSAGQGAQTTTSGLQQALNSQNTSTVTGAQQAQALTSSDLNSAYNANQGIANQAASQNTQAQSTYPHTNYGLSGATLANLYLALNANNNNQRVNAYGQAVNNAALTANESNQQAGLDAQASGSNMKTAGSAAAIVATAAAAYCWVARSVYGWQNPKWQEFRSWMLLEAPAWFQKFYLKHGPGIAFWLDHHPWAKPPVRAVMDAILRGRVPC